MESSFALVYMYWICLIDLVCQLKCEMSMVFCIEIEARILKTWNKIVEAVTRMNQRWDQLKLGSGGKGGGEMSWRRSDGETMITTTATRTFRTPRRLSKDASRNACKVFPKDSEKRSSILIAILKRIYCWDEIALAGDSKFDGQMSWQDKVCTNIYAFELYAYYPAEGIMVVVGQAKDEKWVAFAAEVGGRDERGMRSRNQSRRYRGAAMRPSR